MPKRRSVHFGVYNVRLLSALDKLLRDKPRYLGELSTSINDALLAVDLNTVELVTLLIPWSRRVRAFAYLSGVWFPKERDALREDKNPRSVVKESTNES